MTTDNVLFPLIINCLTLGEAAMNITGTPIAQSFQPTQQGANTAPTIFIHKISDRRYGSMLRSDSWQPVQSAAFTGAISGTVLTVSAIASGAINVGDILSGLGIPSGVAIASLGTGTGGVGTYNLSQSVTASSESMTTATMTMVHIESQQYESTFQISTLATQNPKTPTQYTASDIANFCAAIMQSSVTLATLLENNVGIERITEVRNPYFKDDRARNEASPSFDFVLTHKQIITTTTPIISATEFDVYEV